MIFILVSLTWVVDRVTVKAQKVSTLKKDILLMIEDYHLVLLLEETKKTKMMIIAQARIAQAD